MTIGKRSILIALAAVTLTAIPAALVLANSEVEADVELRTLNASGIEGEIELVDDGSTLTIHGEAEGLTPGVVYISLIYDVDSPATGPEACEPKIFNPLLPGFILPTMFIGVWDVDDDGEGTLWATNIDDETTPDPFDRVYVPLSKIGTVSIRDTTVLGGFGPLAVMACGEVEVDDDNDDDDGDDDD